MTRRARLERAIADAIAMLDALDGDPDTEPDGDSEPNGDDEASVQWPIWNRAA